MDAKRLQFNGTNRRGSALIMAVVLTVLLAIIATLFMLMSRVDEMATRSIQADRELDAAVDLLVDRIGEVLTEDVIDSTGIKLKKSNPNTEPWDYPKHTITPGGDGIYYTLDDTPNFGFRDDPWLANLEPEMVNVNMDIDDGTVLPDLQPGFSHITDLYGTFADMFQDGYRAYTTSTPASFAPFIDSDGDRISFRNLRATIIDPATPALKGEKADADGDGVSDSRWIEIPGIKSTKGEPLYAAVRIIDNSAMINANTAYMNTDLLGTDWDGSFLSHINLANIISSTDSGNGLSINDLHVARCPAASPVVADFEVFSVRRPNDSAAGYLPFDIGDELTLANRFFLSTDTGLRLGQIWPVTFNPGNSTVGKTIPYKAGDDIYDWMDKVTGPDPTTTPPNLCNRRHLTTVHNSDMPGIRAFDPLNLVDFTSTETMSSVTPLNPQQKIGVTIPIDIYDNSATDIVKQNFITGLAMGIYRGLPQAAFLEERFDFDSTIIGGSFDLREETAWQMAVNTADYQDANSLPTRFEISSVIDPNTKAIYYGTEDLETLNKTTVCVSKIGYVQTGGGLANFYGIEVFNPDNDPAGVKDLADYKIIITNLSGNYKGEFDLTGTVEPSDSATLGVDDTMVFAFNSAAYNEADTEIALDSVPSRTTLISPTPVSTIDANDFIIVYNKISDMPVDCVKVPTLTSGEINYRRVVLPGTNFLLPALSSDANPWELATVYDTDPNTGLGKYLVPDLDPNNISTHALREPADSADTEMKKLQILGIQLAGKNAQLSNIAEIENVLAVGTKYVNNSVTNTHKTATLIKAIAESAVKTLALGTASEDLTLDQEEGVEMATFGRIRLTDPNYWELLDSLTYFDPARDGVDLINVAEGAIVNVKAGTVDPASASLGTLTDGRFLVKGTNWDNGTVFWTDPLTVIEVDLVAPQNVYGLILQAEGLNQYIIKDDLGNIIPQFDSTLSTGMQTRPDTWDDAKWHLLDTPVTTTKIYIQAVDNPSSAFYSLSEIQVGIQYDPTVVPYYYGDNIAGRVNINTAPWYVINQLPWVEGYSGDTNRDALAQAIVAYRDRSATPIDYSGLAGTGFESIAQLTQVFNQNSSTVPAMAEYDIRKNILDILDADRTNGDYTVDGTADDFEERNLIFHRISNLVTVRSDVFTAYITVRIGQNGPERRMIAIFDRSNVASINDKPKLLAIHPVPDPR